MIRSKFLTYWTGKDIGREIHTLDDIKRNCYLERLYSIINSGIWMGVIEEEVFGWGDTKPKSSIKMSAHTTCFTELRLSQSEKHYTHYGLLGLVFDRNFALERHGAPVHYVRSQADETIVGNLIQVGMWLDKQAKNGNSDAEILLGNLNVVASYLKSMSDSEIDNFANLDENEWRIVHTYERVKSGLIKETKQDRPKYKLPISQEDLKMIVLPDSECRNIITKDERIIEWFDGNFPPLLTIEEIAEL